MTLAALACAFPGMLLHLLFAGLLLACAMFLRTAQAHHPLALLMLLLLVQGSAILHGLALTSVITCMAQEEIIAARAIAMELLTLAIIQL
jgi:hypothetical protein